MQDGATVTAADVARLAGVGRAAVSNWRRRYADFPEPVGGTASSPLFPLAAVEDWLRAQGKLADDVPAEERVWQLLRTSTDDLRLAGAVSDVGAFLLYLDRDPDRWAALAGDGDQDDQDDRDHHEVAGRLAPDLAATLHDLPGTPGAPGLQDAGAVPLLRAVADLAAAWGAERTFEFLCGRYLETHSRWVATTPAEVADLMAELADVRDAAVLDPACGAGGLLLTCLHHGAARLTGQEREESMARIAAARLLLREAGTAGARIAAGDAVRGDAFPELRADAVLCTPPFNERGKGYEELPDDPRWEFGLPPRGEPELAWIQHALARTRPGGRVAMLLPPAVAARRSGRRIRAELLRSGALRAVVALPPGAAPLSSTAPHLWMLRRAERDDPLPSHVLMIDVSDPGRAWSETREAVTGIWSAPPGVSGEASQDPPGEASGRAGAGATVALIDLLDEEVDLTPARHVPRRPADVRAEFARTRDRLSAVAGELARAAADLDLVGGGDGGAGDGQPRMTTIGEQSKAGALALHQSPLRMESDSGEIPLLTVHDVTLGRPPTGRTGDDPANVALRAGDVVLPAVTRRVVTRVVSEHGSEAGAVLGPHLHLIRPDPERLDPDFVAGFLRISGRAGAARSPSGSSRIDVRKTRLPRLPLADQRRYGAAFRKIGLVEESSRRAAELGEAVARAGLDGLADGSLRPRT